MMFLCRCPSRLTAQKPRTKRRERRHTAQVKLIPWSCVCVCVGHEPMSTYISSLSLILSSSLPFQLLSFEEIKDGQTVLRKWNRSRRGQEAAHDSLDHMGHLDCSNMATFPKSVHQYDHFFVDQNSVFWTWLVYHC